MLQQAYHSQSYASTIQSSLDHCIQLQMPCDGSENGFHFQFEVKKNVDFGGACQGD